MIWNFQEHWQRSVKCLASKYCGNMKEKRTTQKYWIQPNRLESVVHVFTVPNATSATDDGFMPKDSASYRHNECCHYSNLTNC